MAEVRYNVILDGRVQDGQDQVQVAANIARLFRTDESQIRPLLAGRPIPIKKGLALNEAQKYIDHFERSGAVCHLEEEVPELNLEPILAEPSSTTASAGNLPACPKCHYMAISKSDDLVTKGTCPKCGIVVEKYLKRQREAELQKRKEQEEQAKAVQEKEMLALPHRPNLQANERRTDEKYCGACGKSIHLTAQACPFCGASQASLTPPLPPGVLSGQKAADQKYCSACAAVLHVTAETCPRCGARQQGAGSLIPEKNKTVAGLLALFLGGFGIHKFYLGRIGIGIVYLIFCWTFIPAFIAFFEAIWYFAMKESAFHERVRRGSI